MAVRGDRGIRRVLDKLEASVSSGNYYEAHQMYRTLYFRLLGQNKYNELLEMLENGAKLLLSHDQKESGADLSNLFVEVLVKSKLPVTVEWIEKVTSLFVMMNSNLPERESYLTNATRWSMEGKTYGHPVFHKKIAQQYWKEKNYQCARQHFLRSADGATYAAMLIELHTTRGYRGEVDLFIAQAVLQALSVGEEHFAAEAFACYTESHPAIKNGKGPPYITPLLNFVWFLLKSIELNKAAIFNELLLVYKSSTRRDPTYASYLEKIGQVFFRIEPPPRNRPNGLFGNMIQSFLSQMETGDSSSDEEYHNAYVGQTPSQGDQSSDDESHPGPRRQKTTKTKRQMQASELE